MTGTMQWSALSPISLSIPTLCLLLPLIFVVCGRHKQALSKVEVTIKDKEQNTDKDKKHEKKEKTDKKKKHEKGNKSKKETPANDEAKNKVEGDGKPKETASPEEELKPRQIPLGKKEQKIAKGEKRRRGDYPTFDDVKSDWSSEGDDVKEKEKEKKPKTIAETKLEESENDADKQKEEEKAKEEKTKEKKADGKKDDGKNKKEDVKAVPTEQKSAMQPTEDPKSKSKAGGKK